MDDNREMVEKVARAMYESHERYHGFSGDRWDEEPALSRMSWHNKATAALKACNHAGLVAEREEVREVLEWALGIVAGVVKMGNPHYERACALYERLAALQSDTGEG